MTLRDMEDHVRALRRDGDRLALLSIAHRFVERGSIGDTLRLFTREETAEVIRRIKASARLARRVDPVRLEAYERYLREG